MDGRPMQHRLVYRGSRSEKKNRSHVPEIRIFVAVVIAVCKAAATAATYPMHLARGPVKFGLDAI